MQGMVSALSTFVMARGAMLQRVATSGAQVAVAANGWLVA
jgi:hypothetical protein